MKHARKPETASFGIKLTVFVLVSVLLLILDRVTKLWANRVEPGEVLVENIANLFEFRLVHNTGAAWGIFSDSTFYLGIFSVIVCLVILIAFFVYFRKNGSIFQVVCLALVFAGGLGNAIDRFYYSYVVDFINTTFISFPVFNIADIGVTCGIFFFALATIIGDIASSRAARRTS